MYLPRKRTVLVSLEDGTTVRGRVLFRLWWGAVRLAGVTFFSAAGEATAPAEGTVVLIPARRILVVQVTPEAKAGP
jgi:hypothetical protein